MNFKRLLYLQIGSHHHAIWTSVSLRYGVDDDDDDDDGDDNDDEDSGGDDDDNGGGYGNDDDNGGDDHEDDDGCGVHDIRRRSNRCWW